MKSLMHGIIFAYDASPELNGLVLNRTSASLPFGGRYRLIDFILSSMVNAGISDVGVIVRRNYNSLLDHLGAGKDWELDRKIGGLKIFPPFSLAGSKCSEVRGHMEALETIRPYLERKSQKYIVISSGHVAMTIDLKDVLDRHIQSGAEITAVCSSKFFFKADNSLCFTVGDDGFASGAGSYAPSLTGAMNSLGTFIMSNDFLLKAMDYCAENDIWSFSDYIYSALSAGTKINIYNFTKYAGGADSVASYLKSNMDLLKLEVAMDLFPTDSPVLTKERADVSTYYGDTAVSRSCLVADGCFIEGDIENCILFRGVKIKKGARLRNCIIMQDTVINENADLNYVITDKEVTISAGKVLSGTAENPVAIKKRETV